MNASTENSTDQELETKALETVPAEKPVSVYSVSFAQILNDEEREFLISRARAAKFQKPGSQSSFSKAVFNWRNAIAIAAILAVGVLHFAFQMAFIRSEKEVARSENLPARERVQPQTAAAPVQVQDSEFEVKKTDNDAPADAEPAVRQRRTEIVAPSAKPQSKKKETAESRAERLRRAEKILTGF